MKNENCKICDEKKFYKVEFNNLYLRTDSYDKELHTYTTRVCYNCGVVYQFPQINLKNVIKHYEKNYRKTKNPIYFNDKEKIEFPLQFGQTGISFQRFFHFYRIIQNLISNDGQLKFDNKTTILDYGAYQGAFLYACKKKWDVRTIAYDHNEMGLKLAKNFLGIDSTFKAVDINKDVFNENVHVCTAIQVFEHLSDPLGFLYNVKKNVLKESGYIYIEVPSALSSEFSNPTHLFMYTKDTLKNLFEISGFKIHHISEENIYNFQNIMPVKRRIQKMIHCLASPNKDNIINKKFFIGKKIFNDIKKHHFKNSNKIYQIKLKKTLREILILTYYSVFILIGFISRRLSFSLFKKLNLFLKRLPMLNRFSRK